MTAASHSRTPSAAGHRRGSFAAAGALVFAVVSACGSPQGADQPGGPPGGFAVPVEIVTLEARPVDRTSEFVGVVKSRRSTTIQPQVEGFLTRILVQSGDRVRAGTPLFQIDSGPQQAAVSTLESQRAAREADAGFARQQAQRAKSLLDVGAMSRQEYEQAVAQQAAAEAHLKSMDDQIRQQQAELAYYRVASPVAGVVGDVPVRVGDRVTRTTTLTTIDDNTGGLEVYLNVPVQQATNLRTGLPVEILGESGDVIAREQLNFIASSVDGTTQTVLAKTALAQREGQFRPDQFVRARIIWSTEPTLTVPVVSVIRVSGQQFVYVAERGEGDALVAKQRAVELGPVQGDSYPVVSGVTAGERLIASGTQKIRDGAPVQAAPPGAPPDGGAAPGGSTPRGNR